MTSEFRDKRYSGRMLGIDLMDAMLEMRRWAKLQLTVEAAPIARQQGGAREGRNLTGVFTFAGQTTHGMSEAVIAKPDSDDNLLTANFEWISEQGLRLLRTMAGERFRGMIWMDELQDPELFGTHAIRVEQKRHTLSAKFDDLPASTFVLLEAVINKSLAASAKISAHA
jgi:hypothetical protein